MIRDLQDTGELVGVEVILVLFVVNELVTELVFHRDGSEDENLVNIS